VASDPLVLLKTFVGKTVMVRTQDGFEVQGRLSSVDEYMNLSLDDSEHIAEDGGRLRLGLLHVKGENLVFIALLPS